MKSNHEIIKRIVLSEKSSRLSSLANQYTFVVQANANKLEIKSAVENVFKVRVLKVNTQTRKSKATSSRRFRPGRTASKKIALVKLAAGEKIDIA